MKNSLYLKKYVEIHPNNKMGWYLLGKEYEQSGQQGKANYCFNQSGGIYEAFERSKVPSDIWIEYETRLLKQAHRKELRTRNLRRAMVAMMLILLTLVPDVNTPGRATNKHVASTKPNENPSNHKAANQQSQEVSNLEDPAPELIHTNSLFTAGEAGSESERARILSNLLAKPMQIPDMVTMLMMKKRGSWLMWEQDMPVGYTLKRISSGGALTYQPYDAKECNCEPPDNKELVAQAAEWARGQEQLALLTSAIRAYKIKTGKLPQAFGDLVRPFPGNWISGKTDEIKQSFEPVMKRFKSGEIPGQAQHGGSVGNVPLEDSKDAAKKNESTLLTSTYGNRPFFTEPLKIIVDKQNHRLAVVSGNIMLRNYKVGLGGEKTPQGDFVISDKIINPNGHSNGEFGSRGMQLSASNYAIHGTNEPESVGLDESLGCIRMSQEDVEELFDIVPMGTPVHINKGVLPDDLLAPKERFHTEEKQDQTNPQKTYHWLH
ncbi:L,D-transpeptidase [Paenibacillus pini]|uniref:L,D-TPase catalytic domain-containing protein n=1 Tax=Paenibacillus pini JCM 16418 TaxID=1236976 RepID=W7YDH5_9BACL|nr:L,D-transpeptidase [Paenibacillus pini]GAF06502.1 hypothetical protein JCM16418_459 [Paenibacillus pini JCM 16418]